MELLTRSALRSWYANANRRQFSETPGGEKKIKTTKKKGKKKASVVQEKETSSRVIMRRDCVRCEEWVEVWEV